MLSIGDFNTQILLQQAESTQDDMGGNTYEWTDGVTAWAKVEFKDGKLEDNEDRVSAQNIIEFTIKEEGTAFHNITAGTWRIAYPINNGILIATATQYYTIEGINLHGGLNRYRTFICTARQKNNGNIYIG